VAVASAVADPAGARAAALAAGIGSVGVAFHPSGGHTLVRRIRVAMALLGLGLCTGHVLAQQPSQAQIGAIKSSCRGDYMNVCSNVPTGGQAALQCLQQHSGRVSGGCQAALAAINAPPGGSPAAQTGAPAAAMLPPPGPMPIRAELRLLRMDCGPDYRALCQGVQPGGGRALGCLYSHGQQLRPVCRSALRAAAQNR